MEKEIKKMWGVYKDGKLLDEGWGTHSFWLFKYKYLAEEQVDEEGFAREEVEIRPLKIKISN